MMTLYLGIDFGTSGARAIIIDAAGAIAKQIRYPWSPMTSPGDWINCWETALWSLLGEIPRDLCSLIGAIAIDGTSGTILLTDANGQPVDAPLLYNDSRGGAMLTKLSAIAPENHIVLSATSSLAKLLWMQQLPSFNNAKYLLHQADWLASLLHGRLGVTDYHNALKLGYDVKNLQYPEWLEQLKIPLQLPQVLPPGTPVGEMKANIAAKYGFRPDCLVCTGTTDSTAAFLASGAKTPGEAVTSLGSTLVLKLLSRTPVEDSQYGIYSHRLGDLWLTGGASNTGGAVLQKFFTASELNQLSQEIDGSMASHLDYYPLLQPGDRFPINNPELAPRLEPRPDSAKEFLHGLLESMARIEAKGYRLLQKLGADPLTYVYTAGGGAANATWTAIRQRYLQVPIAVVTSEDTQDHATLPVQWLASIEAAYGAALLARSAIK